MLLKGMQSFKVLAECPIIVVSLFQAYRNCVNKNVKLFVPLIKNVLLLQAKPQEKAHQEAEAQGTIFTGVSKEIRNRAAFGDFITAQVKTMSFLAYLLRVYAQQLNDFLPTHVRSSWWLSGTSSTSTSGKYFLRRSTSSWTSGP
jgi:transformation/transcription domain-associated protein